MPTNKKPAATARGADSAAVTGPARLTLRPAGDRRRRAPKPLGRTDAGPARRVVLPVVDARHHLHIAGTTGKGKSRPDLGMMSEMSRDVFSHFTPSERRAIIGYVKAHADRPQ